MFFCSRWKSSGRLKERTKMITIWSEQSFHTFRVFNWTWYHNISVIQRPTTGRWEGEKQQEMACNKLLLLYYNKMWPPFIYSRNTFVLPRLISKNTSVVHYCCDAVVISCASYIKTAPAMWRYPFLMHNQTTTKSLRGIVHGVLCRIAVKLKYVLCVHVQRWRGCTYV